MNLRFLSIFFGLSTFVSGVLCQRMIEYVWYHMSNHLVISSIFFILFMIISIFLYIDIMDD